MEGYHHQKQGDRGRGVSRGMSQRSHACEKRRSTGKTKGDKYIHAKGGARTKKGHKLSGKGKVDTVRERPDAGKPHEGGSAKLSMEGM